MAAQFKTYSLGLTIKQPLRGSTGYFSVMDTDTYTKISQHDHTGSGNGVNIGTSALSADAVTSAKLRLTNNASLRARNAANGADINLFKLDSSDQFHIERTPYFDTDVFFTDSDFTIAANTSNGSDSKAILITGGGAIAAGRGGRLQLYGTDHASQAGKAFLYAGGGTLTIATEGSQDIFINPNETIRFYVRGDGTVGISPQKWLHFRNNANSADVNFARLNSSDIIEIGPGGYTSIDSNGVIVSKVTSGYTDGGFKSYNRHQKTTAATWTTLDTFTVPTNSLLAVFYEYLERNSDSSVTHSAMETAKFPRGAGTMTNTTTDIVSTLARFNITDTTVQLQVSSGASADRYHAIQYRWCTLATDA